MDLFELKSDALASEVARHCARWTGELPPKSGSVILKSEIYNFHRLDLTRQAGFVVTVYDEDGLKLAATNPYSTPSEAFAEARKIVDNKIEGPRKK